MARNSRERCSQAGDDGRIDIDRLRRAGSLVEHGAGSVVYWEGERSDAAYLVACGRVRLSMAAGVGSVLTLGVHGVGDMFGEAEALDGSPRGATATAVEPSLLVRIRAEDLARLVDDSAEIRHRVVRALTHDVQAVHRQLAAQCSKPTVARVAEQLIELSDADGEPSTVHITQSDLSGWIGATRESTARALGQLRRAGKVRTGRGWVQILDRHALADVDDAPHHSRGP